jgi:hypothetical protein
MFANINRWPLEHWHIEVSSKCSWTGLRYEHNRNVFDYIDQNNKTLTEVLDDPNWIKLSNSFEDNTCPQECKEKCSANKWNLEHATSW